MAAVAGLGAALVLAACSSSTDRPDRPTVPSTSGTAPSRPSTAGPAATVTGTVATGLTTPWGIARLPDGDALITERDSGRILLLHGGATRAVGSVPVASGGEGGLLGIVASPRFATDPTVYVYATTAADNRVLRLAWDGTRLGPPTPVLTGIPRGTIHNGGRMIFGPDDTLYVSTGETGKAELAQDRDSLGGKILRVTTDGRPAPGNPFPGSPVWSYGHRNVQGLAFDDQGRLWASEFGQNAYDELNLIVKGADYGWPTVEGMGGSGRGFTDPQLVWPTPDASPSGLAYLDGHLWMASLHGQRLWRIDVTGARAADPTAFLVGDYGRLRTVLAGPDGTLWLSTSNTDGRGDPRSNDDRILRLSP